MELSVNQIVVIFLIIILIAAIFFINKNINQKHELKVLKRLKKRSPKKIKAQAKYMKNSIHKRSETSSVIDYFKMLFTLF